MSIHRGDALPDFEPAERLAPHAHRKIRAFLANPGDEEAPFWALIYGNSIVDHATAVAVAAELEGSTHTIGEVIEGWRPAPLTKRG